MTATVDTTQAPRPTFEPVETAPVVVAPAPTEVATAPSESLMTQAFALYQLAAVLGLQFSKNERASTEDNKKMFKHWTKVGTKGTTDQATAGLFVAFLALGAPLIAEAGLQHVGYNHAQRQAAAPHLQELGKLTPQILDFWPKGHQATQQEASGKASLLQTDLTNGSQVAAQYRNNVEEGAKNVFQLAARMNGDAARNGG